MDGYTHAATPQEIDIMQSLVVVMEKATKSLVQLPKINATFMVIIISVSQTHRGIILQPPQTVALLQH